MKEASGQEKVTRVSKQKYPLYKADSGERASEARRDIMILLDTIEIDSKLQQTLLNYDIWLDIF